MNLKIWIHIYIYNYSVSYVCIVLLWSSNDLLVVHVFGVLLGKSWDKVNHQQSVHVLMCSSRTWFWPWRNSNISTETPNGSCNNGIWNWCAWAAPKKLFKYYIFHKQLFSPLSQHLGHVVLLHVKDDLNKQASVVSTTCRFFYITLRIMGSQN